MYDVKPREVVYELYPKTLSKLEETLISGSNMLGFCLDCKNKECCCAESSNQVQKEDIEEKVNHLSSCYSQIKTYFTFEEVTYLPNHLLPEVVADIKDYLIEFKKGLDKSSQLIENYNKLKLFKFKSRLFNCFKKIYDVHLHLKQTSDDLMNNTYFKRETKQITKQMKRKLQLKTEEEETHAEQYK